MSQRGRPQETVHGSFRRYSSDRHRGPAPRSGTASAAASATVATTPVELFALVVGTVSPLAREGGGRGRGFAAGEGVRPADETARARSDWKERDRGGGGTRHKFGDKGRAQGRGGYLRSILSSRRE